jgi:hypothetical protein
MVPPVDYDRALAAGQVADVPRFPATEDVSLLASIQVIPLWTGPALRELHGSYHKARTSTISQVTVSIL